MTTRDNQITDWDDADKIALKYLNSALKKIGPFEQLPQDDLKIAQTTALVGILNALGEIVDRLRNEGVDS